MKNITKAAIAVAILSIGLTACLPVKNKATSAPVKQTQAQKAQKAADTIRFTENAEIENIKARLELTSNPGLTGFILLLNEMGQPIMYTGVKGKITSGGKRLTRPFQVTNTNRDCGQNAECDDLTASPSDEGTWGSSNPYVYFWTTSGQYIQWNGKYLYSDKPFRTSVEPLVIAVK